jgi:23S rRNA (cytidine1920-2'-O)/16S rRNA (cytidine1409-2'-O)-methyltransferase
LVKQRLDKRLVDLGLAPSREQAITLIETGLVRVGGAVADKPARLVDKGTPVIVTQKAHPYVSRAALKLVHALEVLPCETVAGKCALDIGASTGGFTQVLLEHGARKVYAVDVGYGQMIDKVSKDSRVVVMDRTNARYLTREQIPEPLEVITCDASFIGLATVLPAALQLAGMGCVLVALIKPQFEAGRDKVGKGGIVKDPAVHEAVCAKVTDFLGQQGWQIEHLLTSPILGGDGNKEFLVVARLC